MKTKIYETQEEFLKDCHNGRFEYAGNIKLKFDLTERVDITVRNIKAQDIKAKDINARKIKAWDVDATNINTRKIKAWNIIIDGGNIDARKIKAWNVIVDGGNIKSYKIKANDIVANDIFAGYMKLHSIEGRNITCYSIKETRQNSFHKCLDGKLIIKKGSKT